MKVETYVTSEAVFDASITAIAAHRDEVLNTDLGGILPSAVRTWLARLRLLEGVPFAHLVADSGCCHPSRSASSTSIANGPTPRRRARCRSAP